MATWTDSSGHEHQLSTDSCGDFPECHDETTPCGCIESNPVAQALILQGVDYSTAEDKAYMAKDERAEFAAHGAMEATVKALAIVLGTDEGHANELILTATD